MNLRVVYVFINYFWYVMVHGVLCICLELFLAWTGCIINISSSLNIISYSYIAYLGFKSGTEEAFSFQGCGEGHVCAN